VSLSRKESVWIAVLIIAAGVYVWRFSGWFGPKVIRIEHSIRSGAGRAAAGQPVTDAITFSLHGDYRLTSIRVVEAADALTNKYPRSLWHLVSRKGSRPTEGFAYGFPVAGMAPAVSNATPQRLRPGMTYQLLVEAGKYKGTNDFSLPNRSARR
jgi:hypothetical protein